MKKKNKKKMNKAGVSIIAILALLLGVNYQDVYNLIMKFKKGNLAKGECKSLTNGNSKISSCNELRDDQIRIIFRHV